jgi:predicted HicB family RNase H-like nuclease
MAQEPSRPVGRPPLASSVWDLHVRVPVPLYDAIATKAVREGVPVNQVIRQALQDFVDYGGTTK